MRMVVAGGGTGGHFFPGLAVAEAASREGAKIVFVGSIGGIEARVAPQRGLPFVPLNIHGVRGGGWRSAARFAAQLPAAFLRAWRALTETNANIVLGLGGYGSVPVVLSAWLRRVPSVLIEQNVHPGFANRLLGRFARFVCTTFAESERFFPAGKAVRTGNPVRQLASDVQRDRHRFHVLVFGGSQGATSLNRVMVEAARILNEAATPVSIRHQTGEPDYAWVADRYRETGIPAEVSAFIDDMGEAYGHADLVVCRSGATTLAELAALGKAAILVPYPFAADDHQRSNAEAVVAHRAAEMILERDLDGHRLAARILHYAEHRDDLTALERAARTLATPDAAAKVLQICYQVAEGH